jgi:hypothetical protein
MVMFSFFRESAENPRPDRGFANRDCGPRGTPRGTPDLEGQEVVRVRLSSRPNTPDLDI